VKVVHDPGERSTKEIEVMQRCSHRNLTRLLAADATKPARWFVMEFHPNGDLEAHQAAYEGKPLAVLRKLRPVVDALKVLHDRKLVHRDIKPHNIFVGREGDWILGDLGVVFDSEGDRLTVEARTLWSKDWRPDWIAGQRLDAYGPDVDIFGLAKVLYFMISGRKVPASQIDQGDNDIRRAFKSVPGIDRVHDFLAGHVVTRQNQLKSTNADQFASALDSLIADLERPVRKRYAFGFTSTHSTTHVLSKDLKHVSSTPIFLDRGDRRLCIRLRLVKSAAGPSGPLEVSATLSTEPTRQPGFQWGWEGGLSFEASTEPDDGIITTEPGVWSNEWMIELPHDRDLRLPSTYQFTLGPKRFADNFRITGLRVNID
jgi:serine/threonine protein kinase